MRTTQISPFIRFLIVAALFICPADVRDLNAQSVQKEMEKYFDRASVLTLEQESFDIPEGTIIERDAHVFRFTSGNVTYARDFNGVRRAAVFAGNGVYSFAPPTEIERAHLRRFFDAPTLALGMTNAVFFFGDSLFSSLTPSQRNDRRAAEKYFKTALKHFGEDGRIDDAEWLKLILERREQPMFMAYIQPKDGNPVIAGFDPFDAEEVYLARISGGAFSIFPTRDLISSFQKMSDLGRPDEDANAINRHYRRDRVRIDGTFSTSTFRSSITLTARVTMPMRTLYGGQRWMFFYLHPHLTVDTVSLQDGRVLRSFMREDSPLLWVELDTVLGPSTSRTLVVDYHGDFIERDSEGSFYAKDHRYWFPRFLDENRSIYEITFRYPEKYALAVAGDKQSERKEEDVVIGTWRTRVPTDQLGFYLDDYEAFEVVDKRIPPVTVYMSTIGHSGITISGDSPIEQVGKDLANCIFFYQNLFGPPLTARLTAAEIPFGHGQAFPGLIHLSWATYEGSDAAGFNELFRAHEAAHQWWGIGVEPRTYHDWWLSEAISEYCGLWYLQMVEGNQGLYMSMLDRWRKGLLSARHHLLSTGQEPAPIWMGYRTETSTTSGDYQRIVYTKGAWVIHMLRMHLLDLTNGKETRFVEALKEFYTTFRNKQASTSDFQETIRRTTGEDLDWFFKQWVYGSSIPSYEFAYKIEPVESKKFRVRVRVIQKNVSDDFRMDVPVLLKFSEGRTARTRVTVTGKMTETELPLVPFMPEEVIFNDMNGVLAEVEEVDW